MSRYKAFGLHLFISAVLLACIATIPLSTWYADGRLWLTQTHRLFLIIFLVDLFAGPLLTMVVYKAGKPSLKLDLMIIILLQLGFLLVGLHALWASRPVFQVALPHQFVLVFANDIPDVEDDFRYAALYRNLPAFGPELVGVRFPENTQEANDLVFQAASGRDLTSFPEHYVPFFDLSRELLENAKSLNDLDDRLRNLPGMSQWIGREDVVWVDISSTRGHGIQLIHRESGQPIQALSLPPQEDPASIAPDRR